jgi:hypothetical protein
LAVFGWEEIRSFGSLRERDSFVRWMREQIASGMAQEVPASARSEPGELLYKHMPTGSIWRLVPESNPYGPGFWRDNEEIAA